jgi:DNA-binding NtrC family response regulator
MIAALVSEEDLEPGPVAVVDDDPAARAIIRRFLEQEGYQVVEHTSGRGALNALDGSMVLCLDLGLGDMFGLDVLRHVQAIDPSLPVVVVTGEDNVETAVSAMRGGAYDYLVKPIDRTKLKHAVRRAFERRQLSTSVASLRSELGSARFSSSVVGRSETMKDLARQVERVIDSDVAVAIYGESGTGKELIARAIHKNGRRTDGPFVAVNCAAIPESLHESELFGHERGAFTGAVSIHKGRFEQALGGTLFLDEVAEMSASTQASLLRTLQERTIRRVGGSDEIPVDVRIVCATNRDLADEVKAGRFREDLYFRLVVFPITLPPLRERAEDISLLAAHFLKKHSRDVGREVSRVSPDALEALSRYRWPGNVRELENVVHRAMLSADNEELKLSDLPPHVRSSILSLVPAGIELPVSGASPDEVVPLKELERRAISRALRVALGNITKAAKMLGMGRATLYRKISESGGITAFRDE